MPLKVSFGKKLLIPLLGINIVSIGGLAYSLMAKIPFKANLETFNFGALRMDIFDYSLIAFIASTVLIIFVVLFFSSRVKKLERVTQALINTNFKGNEKEAAIVRDMALKYNDELSELSKMVLYMNSMLNQYMENLDETLSDKEHIDSELNVAWEIQKGILPGEDTALAGRNDIIIDAVLSPAKDVGGDLYDYFLIDDSHLFFLIGDVSDKGIPAAMFMTVTKTLFNTHAIFGDCKNVKEIVSRVNIQLSRDNPKLMFVTFFAGIIDLESGHTEYIDGGHESPFILKAGGETFQLEKKSGRLPLGVMADFEYDSHIFGLAKGDTIVLYTDGVIDAKSAAGQRFGEDGIIRSLAYSGSKSSPFDVNKTLLQNIRSFSIGSTQFDDIAILTLKYSG